MKILPGDVCYQKETLKTSSCKAFSFTTDGNDKEDKRKGKEDDGAACFLNSYSCLILIMFLI